MYFSDAQKLLCKRVVIIRCCRWRCIALRTMASSMPELHFRVFRLISYILEINSLLLDLQAFFEEQAVSLNFHIVFRFVYPSIFPTSTIKRHILLLYEFGLEQSSEVPSSFIWISLFILHSYSLLCFCICISGSFSIFIYWTIQRLKAICVIESSTLKLV